MLSTHHRSRHVWTDAEMRLLDLLAREAADIIEYKQTQQLFAKANCGCDWLNKPRRSGSMILIRRAVLSAGIRERVSCGAWPARDDYV